MPASRSPPCGRAALALPDAAIGAGIAAAEWPARLQRLHGRLAALLPPDWELWLDGGHNPGAGVVLAEHLRGWADRPVHLLVGMKQSKDSERIPAPAAAAGDDALGGGGGAPARRAPGRGDRRRLERHRPPRPACRRRIARPWRSETGPARVLICGSLYLAGEVLQQDA